MQAGQLRRQVRIERRAETVDTYGQRATTWAPVCTTMAEIEPASGREIMAGQAVNAAISHAISIRYRPGITAAMRVVYQGRAFSIDAPPIDVGMRHRELRLLCSEGLTDGR